MSVDNVIEHLSAHREVTESYVLVREIKLYLNLDHDYFSPSLRIKIWKSDVLAEKFHFTVSHNVHTPTQFSPYFPSRTSASSEAQAINLAIESTTSFLKNAISEGHSPEDSWLVPNQDF
ncbi:hypothetical protein ABHP77_000780 [Vibrio cholerae]|uniref:hypothetical protein n=1 Tax=Vibrio cholerae TaxID=666 RepID=UPI00157B6173|nr:hypothetical protein [Vibrio cholerae]EHD2264011.1 hypothetical protein [Vibrio cholerae]EJK2281941.1 hypothetical protein [Vibrio cholerae]EJL6588591.1 hypothetical protein [Vibrio cholerae]EJO4031600.1 hypothetical protein [Vibrio cholerae]MBJ6913726.1 hypothetical protein [Vibrio cholerae]